MGTNGNRKSKTTRSEGDHREGPKIVSHEGQLPEKEAVWLSLGDDINRSFENFFRSFEPEALTQSSLTDPCLFHQKLESLDCEKQAS